MTATGIDAGVATDSARVTDLVRRHQSAGKARLASMLGGQVEVSSRGSVVREASGEEYLNCGGYGTFLLGHGHPRVVEAVERQLRTHPLSTRLLLDPYYVAAAEALAEIAPDGLEYVYFGTSGADVVEAAIKIARLNGVRRVVSTEGGFHGKSYGALSVSGNRVYRDPFEPLLPDIEHVPFGDLDAMLAAIRADGGRCAVILEPIQAEAGVKIPAPDYLPRIAAECAAAGGILIVDEIATGVGRCGAWWRSGKEGVVPDMLLAGKSLGGGVMPVGAVIAKAGVFEPLSKDPFLHSTTFSGSPIVTAAVKAAIDASREEDVPRRAAELGERLLRELRRVCAPALEAGTVRELRGEGLLIGIDFLRQPLAGAFEIELLTRRVVMNHCMNNQQVVRLTPPVTLTDAEVEWLVDAVGESVEACMGMAQLHRKRGS